MAQFNGIEIVSSPHLPVLVPVLKLSDRISLTDKFRENFDKYLIDLFGEKPFIISMGRKLYAHPVVIKCIKQEIDKKTMAVFHV
jgi:hypothetical protein